MPTLFATANELILNDQGQFTPVVRYDSVSAGQLAAVPSPVPSGAAIQNSNPLSLNAYDPSKITVLPNRPVVGSGVGGGVVVSGSIQTQQTSSRNVQVQYSNLDTDDYAFVYFSSGTPMDLHTGINVAVNGAAGKQIKLELKDVTGNVAAFYLTLSGTLQNYAISGTTLSSYFPQVNTTRIAEVVFVMDKSHMGAAGSVAIETAGLMYVPVISNPTTAPVTDFGQLQPSASEIEPSPYNTVTSFTQLSSSQFNLTYNLPNGGSQRWAAGMIQFQPNRYFNAASSDIVLGVNLTGASYYKIEVEDANGVKVTVRANVTNGKVALTNGLLQSAGVPGFDASQVKAIVLVVDDPGATTGQMTVTTQGLQYTPVVPGDFYGASQITVLPNRPILSSGIGAAAAGYGTPDGTIQVIQPSSSQFFMNYTLADNDDFVFAYLGNGYFDYQNQNAWVGSSMNLGLAATVAVNGPAGRQLKVEVVDVNGARAVYYLNLTGQMQNYRLNFQGMGIDPARVAQIVFVADKQHMGSSGMVMVETRGMAYMPVIDYQTPAPVTDFSGQQPSAIPVEAVQGTTVLNFAQPSANQFSYDFNLPAGGSQRWAAGMILFPSGQTFNASSSDIVLGVTLAGARYYKIEVEDANGVKVVVRVNVTNGKVAVSNTVLQAAGMPGFDASQVKAIVLVVDDPAATTGHMTVSTQGLHYELPVPPGWTRAASNANYAYRIHDIPVPSRPSISQVLEVMDLTTSQVHEIASAFTINAESLHDVNILPDSTVGGAVVVYKKTHTSALYDSINLYQIGTGRTFSLSYGYRNPISGNLTSYNFTDEQIVFNFSSGEVVGIDLGTFLPSVPAGWTRAASNANFAFQEAGGTSRTLSVMDLRTGQAQALVTVNLAISYASHIAPVYDVSPDGLTVIYGVTRSWSATGGETYVQRITDPSAKLILGGDLQGIVMAGTIATLTVQGIEQRVDLTTLTLLPPVLSWSPAASNTGYQMAVEQQPDGKKTLHVKNISTGAETVIANLPAAMDFQDVSPDGSTVLYGKRASHDPAVVGFTTLYSLTVPGRKVDLISGGMMAYSFTAYGEIVLKTFSFAVDVYELGTLERYNFNITNDTVNSPGNIYQLKDERSAGMFKLVKLGVEGVRSFDLDPEDSPITSYLLTDQRLYYIAGHKDPAEVKYVDLDTAYATGNFDPVTLSTEIPLGSRGAMEFVSAGELLKITRDSGHIQYIDLSTGQAAYPVPAGWTRAASNANFAYRITSYMNEVGMGFQKLEVTDLVSGETYLVKDVLAIRGGYSIDGADVSIDGKYALALVRSYYGPLQADVYFFDQRRITITAQLGYAVVSSTEFKTDQIWLHTRDHDFVIDLATGETIKLIVIDGVSWTRAPSNISYAFQYQTREEEDVLVLKDLKTGAVTELRAGSYPVRIDSNGYDVSPTGLAVIYKTTNGAQKNLCLQSLADPSKKLILEGELQGVSYEGNGGVAVLIMADGTKRWVDLKTLTLLPPPVPQGWTRAVSNENFAFRIEDRYVGGGSGYTSQTLQLMDLVSGQVKDLVTKIPGLSLLGDVYDVSPDGITVVYSYADRGPTDYEWVIVVEDLQNSVKQRTLPGKLKGVEFLAEKLARLTYEDLGVIKTAIVDYNSMSVCQKVGQGDGYEVVAAYEFFLIMGSQVVRVPDRAPLHPDILQGTVKTNGVIYFHFLYAPRSNPSSDIYQAYDISSGQWSSVTKLDWENALLAGGWTRAASNVNYAFKLEIVGSYAKLYLMDLLAGTSQELISANGGGRYPVRISDAYDVSPDGTTVVYGITQPVYGGATYLQRISDPSQKLILSGPPKKISFQDLLVKIVKVDNTVQWVDLKTLKVTNAPVPEGWTQAPRNANFAYRIVINGNMAELWVMDLRKDVPPKKIASIYYRNGLESRFGNTIEIDPTGTVVIYETFHRSEGTKVYVQNLADAAKKLKLSGKITEIVYGTTSGSVLIKQVRDAPVVMENPGSRVHSWVLFQQSGVPVVSEAIYTVRQLAIADLYVGLLGRNPEKGAVTNWDSTGWPLADIKRWITTSPERQNRIAEFYRKYLGREPEKGATYNWAVTGMKLSDIEKGIMVSQERQSKIKAMSLKYCGTYSAAGIMYWAKTGLSLVDVENAIKKWASSNIPKR